VSSQAHEDQRKIFREQLRELKKPEQAWPKIIEGKLGAWLKEVCLSEQESVVHAKKTIGQLQTELILKCGENVRIRRFMVWELGEGLTKTVKEDLASEISRLTSM
jgi:elongation factor Ts